MKIVEKYRVFFLMALLVLVVSICVFFFQEHIQSLITVVKSEHTHPMVVLAAFLVLPMLFFPISVLLVLIGIRFGAFQGIVIMFGLIPAHLVVSFLLTRSFLHARLERIVKKRVNPNFWTSHERGLEFSVLFMAVPGLPYAVKNYLLPLSGIPFREYFLISWLVQSTLGIPIVVLGDAASSWNLDLAFILALLLLVIYLILRYIRQKYIRKRGSIVKR